MKTGLRIKVKILLESCTQRAVHKACKKIQHKSGKLKQSSSTKISQIPNFLSQKQLFVVGSLTSET